MKDITNLVKSAIEQDVPWSIDLFFEVLQLIGANDYDVSFWEGEENWAILSSQENKVGYLWKKYPLLLILQDFNFDIKKLLQEYSFIKIQETKDLNKIEFSLDFEMLKDYIDYNSNYDAFSATDLWFNTNSI